jgi:hypothetical protein
MVIHLCAGNTSKVKALERPSLFQAIIPAATVLFVASSITMKLLVVVSGIVSNTRKGYAVVVRG